MTATAKEGRNVGGLNNHVNVLMLVLSSLKSVYFCRFYGIACPQQSTKAPYFPPACCEFAILSIRMQEFTAIALVPCL